MRNEIMMDTQKQKVTDFLQFLQEKWNGKKPLAKLFRTDEYCYIYDTGTNKISKCDPLIFELLEKLLDLPPGEAVREFLIKHDPEEFQFASGTIKNAMEVEKILLTTTAEKFGITDGISSYEELIGTSLETLFLEVTESCNLRCGYCVYGGHYQYKRNHGQLSMTRDIACRALDYLKEHSSKSKRTSVSFYGGEPLLDFELVKFCAGYAKDIIPGNKLSFAITTNGTILTPEMAEFFYENDFRVLVSIDGPQDIHDSFRLDLKGKGSHKRTVDGLKNLIDVYGDSAGEKIHLSMVYTPPFSGKRLDRLAHIWDEIPWLPKNLNVNITYPARGSIQYRESMELLPKEDKSLL